MSRAQRCICCGAEFHRQPNSLYCWPCSEALDKRRTPAYRKVSGAVKSGKLPHISTQYCVDCGAFASRYDHRDYSKPLDVVPVCNGCNIVRGPAIAEQAAA